MPSLDSTSIVQRLIDLQRAIRAELLRSRSKIQAHAVVRDSSADTIYKIDAAVEPLLEDFCRDWSRTLPLVLIAEGIEGDNGEEIKVFPEGTREQDAAIRLIIDPIDGTRGLMYDKRAAWSLAGIAPNKGASTKLSDIEIAVMTELPTSKMGYADVLWAVRGGGAVGARVDLANLEQSPLQLSPSTATTIDHGFAMITNFFPGTKVLASSLMEFIAARLTGAVDVNRAAVFDDQYISTGGQFYELIVGHDRFNADLRPLFYRMQNQPMGLCCHPYDCATALIATEAGVHLTDGLGGPFDGPLDTTSPVTWAGYANGALRRAIEPLIREFIQGR
ncbi:MAG TPA: hypothetical protein VH370_20575 [Humisphaera sp.]|jgi:fructose-1,6-bisphosphatase/inositol monophosphatase family enzyme|nr:hypothetical protein [Humisphaera sp.]